MLLTGSEGNPEGVSSKRPFDKEFQIPWARVGGRVFAKFLWLGNFNSSSQAKDCVIKEAALICISDRKRMPREATVNSAFLTSLQAHFSRLNLRHCRRWRFKQPLGGERAREKIYFPELSRLELELTGSSLGSLATIYAPLAYQGAELLFRDVDNNNQITTKTTINSTIFCELQFQELCLSLSPSLADVGHSSGIEIAN